MEEEKLKTMSPDNSLEGIYCKREERNGTLAGKRSRVKGSTFSFDERNNSTWCMVGMMHYRRKTEDTRKNRELSEPCLCVHERTENLVQRRGASLARERREFVCSRNRQSMCSVAKKVTDSASLLVH